MFNMSAMQAPLPPANMPIPDPAILAGMPIPPTATSSQLQASLGSSQQNPIPNFNNLQVGQEPQGVSELQQQQIQEAFSTSA